MHCIHSTQRVCTALPKTREASLPSREKRTEKQTRTARTESSGVGEGEKFDRIQVGRDTGRQIPILAGDGEVGVIDRAVALIDILRGARGRQQELPARLQVPKGSLLTRPTMLPQSVSSTRPAPAIFLLQVSIRLPLA